MAITLVLHEASRTGAPAIGALIAREGAHLVLQIFGELARKARR